MKSAYHMEAALVSIRHDIERINDKQQLNLILTSTSPEAEQGRVLVEAMSQFLKVINHALTRKETV
jgi:hypothetical protein